MKGFAIVGWQVKYFLFMASLMLFMTLTTEGCPRTSPETKLGIYPADSLAEIDRDSTAADAFMPSLAPIDSLDALISHAVTGDSVAIDSLSAIPEKPWHFSGTVILTINQSSFTNWVAGGVNQIGLITVLRPRLLFDNRKWSWFTQMDMRFGLQKHSNERFSKSEDILRLETKLGKQIRGYWSFNGIYTINTQLAPTYDGSNQRLLSGFMAPGYTNLGLGFDYRRAKIFSLYLSPINMRTTYVLNDSLAQAGEFGVSTGSRVLRRLGPAMIISYANTIWEHVRLDTQLGWFQDLNDQKIGDPVVNFDAIFKMQVNKILTVTALLSLFYDQESRIDVKDEAGNVVDRVAKIQIKQTFGLGLTLRW